jgi:hypothetical protein
MPLVIAPLAAVVVAIVAVLLIYAFYQLFHPLLEGIANAGGIIGSTLASVIDGILSWAYGYAVRWGKVVLHDVLGLILAPVFWIEHHIEALTNAINILRFVVNWSMNSLLPLKIGQALALAHTWDVGVEGYAASLVNNLTNWTRAQFASTDAYIAAGLAADANYAAGLFRSAEAYTTAGLAAESAYMAAGLKALENFTAAGLAADGAYAQSLFTSAINYTTTAVGGLTAGIEKDLSAITAVIGNAELSLATSIALAQSRAIAYTDARVGEVEGELGRWADDCLKSMCGGLGDLAKLFNALNDGFTIAAIIALISEVLADPHGVAAGIKDAVVTPAADVLSSVIG